MPPRQPSDRAVTLDPNRSLKPLMAEVIREAVHLALIDSAIPDGADDDGGSRMWTEAELEAMHHDIYAIPSEALARMDPGALARNVAVRLLGTGGWSLMNGDEEVYTGNATAQEIWDLSIARPSRSHIDEMAMDVTEMMRRAHEEADDEF